MKVKINIDLCLIINDVLFNTTIEKSRLAIEEYKSMVKSQVLEVIKDGLIGESEEVEGVTYTLDVDVEVE